MKIYDQDQRLQWLKGEKIGTVETVVAQDGEWTTFKSGARISTDLINEFMILINDEPLDFIQIEPISSVQSPTPLAKKVRTVNKIPAQNPIRTLFNKQKKTDTIDLVLTFPINAPTSDIFNIISSSFDKTEVINELTAFIMDQIKVKSIQNKLTAEIQDLITKKFKH